MFKEQTQGFFTFIREQGVVGLAVGFILGGAVSALVKSIVEDIINPLISSTIRDIDTLNSIMLGPVAFGSFISALIDFIGRGNLSNLQSGLYSSDFGLKTTEEISAMYEAEDFKANEPVLLININRLYRRDMTEEDLYEATRKAWVIGKQREKAKYAVATYRGLTREVYKIHKWYPIEVNGKTRWGFEGVKAEDEIRSRYRYKSIAKYFVKGAANPIKYVNC